MFETESCEDDKSIGVNECAAEVKIAKWEEDNVWYRAIILGACGAQMKVKFIDYGNEDVCSCIVDCIDDVPHVDKVDEYVLSPHGVAVDAEATHTQVRTALHFCTKKLPQKV